ncbi:hypothetical protein SAMN05421740_109128 [Parapedobacter koreensis]|uniref:Uncharacterized protein n=1 Tax=Parapedobacter koreensis TaxID=332977 RepID=A0A1H7SQU3_9SPHI|nr:hypothetical protein SAMN05421740_109128 [Parapedobacter koreensis]
MKFSAIPYRNNGINLLKEMIFLYEEKDNFKKVIFSTA